MGIGDIPGGGGELGPYMMGLPGVASWVALFQGDWQSFFRLWLDPFDLWFSRIFAGRPKVGPHSATDSVALFLLASPNPVVRLWGMGVRTMEAQGIPLSTGNPVHVAQFRGMGTAAFHDMQRQFGSTHGVQIFGQLATEVNRCNNPASNRRCIAERKVFVDQPYNLAVLAKKIDPITGFPFPAPCAPGFHQESGRCVRNPPPPPRVSNCCG